MSTVTERRDLADLAMEIAEHLRDVRRRLAEEIRAYPTPITRCDAQFNHLYEQQGKLARDLDRIESGKPARALIEEFAASAPYTDDRSERAIRSRVRAALQSLASV